MMRKGQSMKIVFFYYDGFAEFEIAQACLLLGDLKPLFAALERRVYASGEGQRFIPSHLLSEIDPETVDLFVIPGGESSPLYENAEIKAFIEGVLAAGKKVAGICGGSELLAALGFLKGKKCTGNTSGVGPTDAVWKYYEGSRLSDDHVVADGAIITAQGQAFTEFAVLLAEVAGLHRDASESQAALNWLRNARG